LARCARAKATLDILGSVCHTRRTLHPEVDPLQMVTHTQMLAPSKPSWLGGQALSDFKHEKDLQVLGRVRGPGFRVQGSGFRVQVPGFRIQGAGCRIQGSGFRAQGSGFRIQGEAAFSFSSCGSRISLLSGLGRSQLLALPHSGSPIIIKSTCWDCAENPSSSSSVLLSSLELSDTQSICALNTSPSWNRCTFL